MVVWGAELVPAPPITFRGLPVPLAWEAITIEMGEEGDPGSGEE